MKKNLTSAKRELEKLKKEEEKLTNKKVKIELETSSYQQELDKIHSETDEMLKNAQTPAQVDFVMNMETSEVDNLNQKYSKSSQELSEINQKLSENKVKQDQINHSVDDMNKKINNINGFDSIKQSVDGVGNSITGVIKKVAKWTLAIFGIKTAYTAIRSAMGTLSQYNDQLATDTEYIKFALASVLQPVIEGIIKLVYKLLSYVNYLSKAWFGVNLFGKATVNNFNKADKSAKKLKKTLGSFAFDELNILEDNSESKDDSEPKIPSTDLSNIEDIEPPKWLQVVRDIGQWIIDHWQAIVIAIGLVGAALIGIKIANFIRNLTGAKKGVEGLGNTFKGFFDGLGRAAEAIAILGGLTLVIQAVTDLIDTFSKSSLTLGEVAGLLGIVLGELTVAFTVLLGVMTLITPSWQSIAAAAVIFAGFSAAILSVNELLDTMAKNGMSVGEVGLVLAEVVTSLITLITALTIAANLLQSPMAMAGLAVLAASISAILLVVAATLPIILEACSKFINDIGPFVLKLLDTIYSGIEKIITALGTVLPPIIESVGNMFTKIFNGIATVVNSVGNVIVNILNATKNLVTTVLSAILNFINKLGPAINNFVDNAITAVTKLINFLISGIEYMINTLIIAAINGLISAVNKIPLVDIPKLPKVTIERFRPRLASGGIVDVPKSGVNIGGAIAGEAGAEGVLPLTNADTMSRLGQEIGKWITLNLDITNTLDGRVLNRRLETIKNENIFSRNGV